MELTSYVLTTGPPLSAILSAKSRVSKFATTSLEINIFGLPDTSLYFLYFFNLYTNCIFHSVPFVCFRSGTYLRGRAFAYYAMGRRVDPSWSYPVCGMVHIKYPLLLMEKSSLCGGTRFPLSLSEWSFIIRLTPCNRN